MGTSDVNSRTLRTRHSQPSLLLICFFVTIVLNSSGVSCAKFSNAVGRTPRHRYLKGVHGASKISLQPDRHYEKGDQERQKLFEVSKPVDIPQGSWEVCSQVLLEHRFGNTINDPPTLHQYTPKATCGNGGWTLVLLKWTATCSGRQFDRISAVWLNGVEIFRTCTAEPTPNGIVWTVEKDVTRFSALFKKPQMLALELANVVDETYTGIYNVTLSAHFYVGGKAKSSKESYGGVADVILPFAEVSPLKGGHWFQLQNESDVQSREIQIPRNAYKAVLEICISFHGDDEFWYANPPNDFLLSNNISDQVAGNGTFREVLVSIDGLLAGVVYPFPVFYTGGADQHFWRPISGIGSFVLPSYDIEITPFLGRLIDDRNHSFSATVTNALPFWLINANLHLWVDSSVDSTRGKLTEHSAGALQSHITSRFRGLDGTFRTESSRALSYKGYLESSFGNLTTIASYSYRFSNELIYTDGASSSEVHQESNTEEKVMVKSDFKDLVYNHRTTKFPLKFFYRETQHQNGTLLVKADIEHSWDQDQQTQSVIGEGESSFSTLKNKQRSKGELVIPPKGAITRGVATTKQKYAYESTEGCYFRSLGISNYTFLYDTSDRRCSISSQ
ncbi:peptide-N4-(N-acetyl-beta-glucosaminyl)asparagine amidase A [Physcomitrium patens]|uniref:Peptide N-acetyl-beta-D-glucosaminyl asparaginase amidase A N-terminal domain-containing protein n=2 Tax=Physcomitrium patens TaxID=3218 RepID=A0A2K1IR76_PHYPA|nr:peptide-N4-(N-acetyl-beta-glucosaminyl)asparagine amidase A-like [Physcomitrium patens]XP_024359685.1 peptide-N4-(N-acetyl-beta-glucosaminyl)asparagine amidase A-like [Physcomitrium patens]PNR31768.1 hypothetical protein PHYPA_025891 [Physcomitrium patens]|eukprot:XP_024359684.1 peptide-N4-(N-acetyl-beta-glucosaminyl)asparagine amidase A-like [Physcomitrella patens]